MTQSQASGIDAVRKDRAHAWTLPPRAFSSSRYFRWEQASLIRDGWHCVGRVDHLPAPGDYRAFELAGTPLVMVRDRKHELRVYSNVCRHRGMILARGEGSCRRLQCPFHGWTYDLDGSLVAAALMDQTEDFDKNDFGLPEIDTAETLGFVFINLSGNAAPLEAELGDFESVHAPWSLQDMVTTRRKRFDVKCNWKLFLQVFMEYYHLPVVHAGTLADIRYQPASAEVHDRGCYSSLFGLHEGTGAVLETDGSSTFDTIATLGAVDSNGSRYTHVFPSMAFCSTRDCMWFYECYPVSANESVFYMNSCFPKATTERDDFETVAHAYYDRWDIALAEDIDVLELQQTGLESPLAKPGRYSWMESGVAYFERWIAERVKDDSNALEALGVSP